MDKKLFANAEHTINIEYPGMTFEQALDDSSERALNCKIALDQLQDQLNYIRYQIDQTTCDYHSAMQANALFENVLVELENQSKEA